MPGSNLSAALATEAWEAVSTGAGAAFHIAPMLLSLCVKSRGLGAGPQSNRIEFLLTFSGFTSNRLIRVSCIAMPGESSQYYKI